MIQDDLLVAPGMRPEVAETQVNSAAHKEGYDDHFHLDPVSNGNGPQVAICYRRYTIMEKIK